MSQIFRVLLLITCLAAVSVGAEVREPEAAPSIVSYEDVFDRALDVFNPKSTFSCRADGFTCRSSIECCSYCMSGVCGGQTYNKPDGASCQSSIECQSYCTNGVCGGQTYNKPDGASCESSIECQTYCWNGRCGGV